MTKSSNPLAFGLSCESNTRLQCWSYGVPYIGSVAPYIGSGFSIVIGLKLEFSWLSLFGSLSSLPSDLDQILPKEKVG